MIRSLAVVAVGGALISVVCIGASGALQHGNWHIPSMSWNIDSDESGPALHMTGREPQITRDLPWAGGAALTFDVPASVIYTQGPVAKITLSGPDVLVNHVVLHDATLKLDRAVRDFSTDNALHIAVTAPALHDFQLDSAVKLDIHNLSTDELRVQIDGAGKVDAQGSARSVKLQIDGAGDADFNHLVMTDANIEINGLGHVIAGPTGDAHVQIDGAGSVTLTKRPAHLSQQVEGAGNVTQPKAPAGESL